MAKNESAENYLETILILSKKLQDNRTTDHINRRCNFRNISISQSLMPDSYILPNPGKRLQT